MQMPWGTGLPYRRFARPRVRGRLIWELPAPSAPDLPEPAAVRWALLVGDSARFGQHVAAAGYIARGGQIIDVTNWQVPDIVKSLLALRGIVWVISAMFGSDGEGFHRSDSPVRPPELLDIERRRLSPTGGCAREALGTPGLPPPPVGYKEQPGGTVFLLHRHEPRVVRPPIGLRPSGLEEIALGEITSAVGREAFEQGHGATDHAGGLAGSDEIGRMAGEVGIGGRAFAADDRQCEGIEHFRVHRRVAGGGARRWGASGETLLEVELDRRQPARRRQRVGERSLLIALQQRGRKPQRLVAEDEMARLREVGRPEHVVGGRARAIGHQEGGGQVGPAEGGRPGGPR